MLTRTWFSGLLSAFAALGLLGVAARSADASVYGYATQQTNSYVFTGASVGLISAGTSSSSAQLAVPSGSDAHSGVLDALESYVGPSGGKPAENTFTPKGQTTPDYSRGDTLVTASPNPFTTDNVAELFLTNAGNSSAAGSWSVSLPLTVSTPGSVTLSFNFTNQLQVVDSGSPAGSVQAAYSYNYTIQNSSNAIVFSSSPTAVNNSISLSTTGSTTLPGSGSVAITSGTLAAGNYTATISGNETSFANLVPEPSGGAISAVGLLGLAARRRRRSA